MNTRKPTLIAAALLTLGLTACSQNPVTPGADAASTTVPPAATTADAAGKQPTAADPTGRGAAGLTQDGKGGDAPTNRRTLESIGAPEQRSVYFDYDRFDIRNEFKDQIAAHGKFITGRADARMLIQGNADERGSREYNLALGQRRADAVKKALMVQGIKEESLESVSLGEEKPKATGHDEAAWAENRRADMLYKGEY